LGYKKQFFGFGFLVLGLSLRAVGGCRCKRVLSKRKVIPLLESIYGISGLDALHLACAEK